jgi:SEC-C motif
MNCAFEVTSIEFRSIKTMSKRRRGFPSEARVKRGERMVHGNKLLSEKLGRNDPCPCGSRKLFQALLPAQRLLSTAALVITINADYQPDYQR